MKSSQPSPSREISARTWLIAAAVLLVSGTIVTSPTAGIAAFILGAMLSLIGIALGYRRYGNAGFALLIVAILLTTWRLPDARDEYRRYLDKTLADTR